MIIFDLITINERPESPGILPGPGNRIPKFLGPKNPAAREYLPGIFHKNFSRPGEGDIGRK